MLATSVAQRELYPGARVCSAVRDGATLVAVFAWVRGIFSSNVLNPASLIDSDLFGLEWIFAQIHSSANYL